MSRKSQYKKAIKEQIDGVFLKQLNDLHQADYAVEDGMIQLASVYDSEQKPCTGRQILFHILHNTIQYLDSSRCRVFCLCFDKPEHVFAIKGIEQKRRNKKSVNPAPDPAEGEDVLPLNTRTPYQWASMLANREMRKVVLKKLVELMTTKFYPPAGKIMVIDSSNEVGPTVIRSLADEKTYANSKHSVLEGISMYAGELSPRTIEQPEYLRNRIGESDHCHLFHLLNMLNDHLKYRSASGLPTQNDPIYIDVVTRDTDYIPLDLVFSTLLEEHNFHMRVCMTIQRSQQDLLGDTKEVLDLDRLHAFLRKKAGDAIVRPDLCLAAAMISSDNDYVDGYYGLTPDLTLKVLLNETQYVGGLVRPCPGTGVWEVDELAYLRLLKALYCYKYKAGITKYIANARKKQKKDKDLELHEILILGAIGNDDCWQKIPWAALYAIIATYNEKAHIPDYQTIWLRYLRLQLSVRVLQKAYTEGPDGTDSLCLTHGYALIDPTRPLSKHNIRLAVGTDTYKPITSNFMRELGVHQ